MNWQYNTKFILWLMIQAAACTGKWDCIFIKSKINYL